jgi:outer membrane protein
MLSARTMKYFSSLAFLLWLFLMSFCAQAQTTDTTIVPAAKTWELGIGVGAITGPDYRGSKEYHHYVAPIPYVIYRGKYIQTDRDGVRSKLFERERYELNLSLGASITADSDENKLREGMPELYSTIEFGPAFNINLTGDTFSRGWFMHLPLRGVVAVGGGETDYVGWLVHPQLVYREQFKKWNFGFRTGVYYGSEDYHQHYYSVDPQYVTTERAAYQADAGYSGWSNQMALSRSIDDFRLAFFVRYDNLSGTNFSDSPLVETEHSFSGGVALIWVYR